MKHEVLLRSMLRQDLPQVMRIETASYPYPWTKGIFLDCLKVGYECLVAEQSSSLLGHAVLSIAAGESHILNLTVDETARNQGLGKQILCYLIDLARVRNARQMLLEVRPSNLPARHLYHQAGFTEIGCRKNYYPGDEGRENALILSMSL